MAKTKLNIFLAKNDKRFEELVKDLNPEPIRKDLDNGIFLYKQVEERKPKWIESFFNDEVEDDELRNKTIQAVYITEVTVMDGACRIFALTFGLGRNLLKLENFEERFGIITAMNLINAQTLRSVDINSLDGNPKSQRIQVGRLGSLIDFELDDVYDILKNINGRVDENRIEDAKSIGGRQSLSITLTTDIYQIGEVLNQLYSEFQSNAYKEKFPGIDDTREIKDAPEIEMLDANLLEIIQHSDQYPDSTVALSFPEIVEDSEIHAIRYSNSHTIFDEITLSDMKSVISGSFGEDYAIDTLKRERIRIENAHGMIIRNWSIYKCFVADIRINGHQYVLNDGKWYVYDDDFAAQVNEFYERVQISPIDLIDCAVDQTEEQYNDNAYSELGTAVLWDRKLLNPYKKSKFELCDIFDKPTKSFIHIKKQRGSADLSHLFLQGSVSGELMLSKAVRKAAIEIKHEMAECIEEDNYNASSYNVVYGIIEKNNDTSDRPKIPFFSKVSFRQIANNLLNIGYTVQLKSIKWRG